MTAVCVTASWPMGHRLKDHDGKCAWLHGHTYKLEAEVLRQNGPGGEVHGELAGGWAAEPRAGMVADFSFLKSTAVREIVDDLDHAMVLQEGDECLGRVLPYSRVIRVEFPPTAEMLARYLRKRLNDRLPRPLRCVRLRLWESEQTWAEDRE